MFCTWKLLFMHDSRNDGSTVIHTVLLARRRLLQPPCSLLPFSWSLSSSRFHSTRWLDGIYFGIVSNTRLPFLFVAAVCVCLLVFSPSTLRLASSQVKFANACIKTILACRNIESIPEAAAGSFHFISFHFIVSLSPSLSVCRYAHIWRAPTQLCQFWI